jgi:hypothetical protein
VDRGLALAREWDELVDQVRSLHGFEDFLQSPETESFVPSACAGPVAIINVSQWRCDGLIVTEDGVRVCPLPHLTLEAARSRTASYLASLHAEEQAYRDYLAAKAESIANPLPPSIRTRVAATEALAAAQRHANATLVELQGWLWDVIAAPILQFLGFDGTLSPGNRLPRIWWCPTGPLSLLPLHAAGYHAESPVGPPRTVMDRVVSSYTPTLRTLVEARAGQAIGAPSPEAQSDKGIPRMLLVAVPGLPDQPELDSVARERATLTELFPGRRLTVLEGPVATREAVLKELPQHSYVHFSCHGDQDLLNPSRGGLLLRDGMLTIADITIQRSRGDFAGLSACKTAVGGVSLLDETITLAAALHYTGFRHVVAAQWSVDDATSAIVFNAFYKKLAADERLLIEDSAVALHEVVRAVRDTARGKPRFWAPFTHTGP